MKVELSKKEIKVIQKCLLSVEFSNMALKLGNSKELMELYDRLEKVKLNYKKSNNKARK